jgi:regulator of protease activity HflC (stomatin/prohibitin superfamily)
MWFFSFLFWILFLYGLVGLVLRLFFIDKEVPTGEKDGMGRAKTITEKVKIELPLALPAMIVGFIMGALFSMITKVGPQDVGVLVTPKGVSEMELHTGWHIVMPWCDVHMMDKTVWVYTCANAQQEGAKPNADAIWSPTKDGIKMGLDVSVSWKIIPDEASWIYQNVTENDGGNTGRYIWLEDNIIRTKLKSALALTVSNYNPIEVYSTKRQEIQDEVIKRMKVEVKESRS